MNYYYTNQHQLTFN